MNTSAFSRQSVKRIGVATLLALIAVAGVQAQYPKSGIRLNSQISLSQFISNPAKGSGCSGYTSPSGREYVVMGLRNGTTVVEVTNPALPVQLGHITGPESTWHESAVSGAYAYCGTEAGGGVQIIDLTLADQGIISLAGTYTGSGLSSVHTAQANSHYLYLNGSNRNFVILDISNPTSPIEVARWTTRYVHDCVIVTHMSGAYVGKEIAYLCNGQSGLTIVDITNKSNLVDLGTLNYVAKGYCHSGGLSADYRYLYINDELDEINGGQPGCKTYIIDVSNLAAPTHVASFANPIGVIDHNSVLKDGYLNLAAYRAGLRVYDTSNPLNLVETGFFDTYPSGQGLNFNGAWGTFVFPSGTNAIADMERGLFLVDPSEARDQGAPLLDLSFVMGALQSGTLKSMKFADGQALTGRWDASLESDTLPMVDMIVGGETTRPSPTRIDLTLKAKVTGKSSASCNIRLKNWSNGQFVTVGNATLTISYSTVQLNSIDIANFVNATGRIEARLGIVSQGLADVSTFSVIIDQFKLRVRTD